MIEVEKKFQPTEEQLQAMLEGAEFLGEVTLHDIYYDYPDYRFFKKDIRLRNRNGSFELKIGKRAGIAEEIENKKEIERYFGVEDLENFITNNLIPIMDYSNNRKSYKKDGFNIGLDDMSFGYKMCEIEVTVSKESEIEETEKRIKDFANKYNFENKKVLSKRKTYLKMFKPEIYKELYGDK